MFGPDAMKYRILLATEFGWPGDEIAEALKTATNVELNILHRDTLEVSPSELGTFDIVLTFGPHYGNMLALFRQVRRAKASFGRPKLFWWLNENLPSFKTTRLNLALGRVRHLADILLELLSSSSHSNLLARLGHRYRILYCAVWGQKGGTVDNLAVTSGFRKEQFKKLGVPSIHVPMGYGPTKSLGELCLFERNIDLLFLGSLPGITARKRKKALRKLEKELRARGIKLTIVSDWVTSAQRTELLNQTKILLNLIRLPEDWNGHRLLLGAANGAMNISETMVDKEPFVDGVHIATASRDELPELISYYLKNDVERQRITMNAADLVTTSLTMKSGLLRFFAAGGITLEF